MCRKQALVLLGSAPDGLESGVDLESLSEEGSAFSLHFVAVKTVNDTNKYSIECQRALTLMCRKQALWDT